jgi:putative ABC transport system permease protein
MSAPPLPSLVHWIIRHLAPREWRESITGDLQEEADRRRRRGARRNDWWSVRAALWMSVRLSIDRRRTHHPAPRSGRYSAGRGFRLDLRQAARGLVRHRGYALTAVLTLAIGIGATTSVFSLTNGLLLRPIAGVDAEARLVTIYLGGGGGSGPMAMRAVDEIAAAAPALAGLAGTGPIAANVEVGGVARRVNAEVVTGNYFDVLGRSVVSAGRGFTRDEGRNPGASPVAVISDRFRQEAFGAASTVVGVSITVNGERWTVIGVATRDFNGPSRTTRTDIWVPVAQFARVLPGYKNVLTSLTSRVFDTLVGRLSAGATVGEVSAQTEVVRTRMSAEKPNDFQLKHWRFLVRPGVVDRDWVGSQLGGSMMLLLGFVVLLLFVSCANAANLMLMRATARRSELGTHMALGASRGRLIRLLLFESLALATAGGGLALVLCALAGRAIEGTVVLQMLPPIDRPPMDWRVFGFAAAVSGIVAVVSGVFPALTASRADVIGALSTSSRTHTAGRTMARRLMATLQVGISLTLVVGALLLTRSMAMRHAIDPGFDPSRVLAFSVEPGLERYDASRVDAFYRQVLDRVRGMPGVRAAGIAWLQPFSPYAGDEEVRAEGHPATDNVSAEYNVVSPGFFDALGLRFVEGRDFRDAELFPPAKVPDSPVIISQSLARHLFGLAPAVGRRIQLHDPEGATRLIEGVVADMRQRRVLEPPDDMLFEPMGEGFAAWSTVLVRLGAPADVVARSARATVAAIDPAMPIYHVATLDAEIARQFSSDTLLADLARVFAAMATLLAAVGVYGVLARTVAERRREFGIRMAIGARPVLVARLVTHDAAWVVAPGLIVGLAASAGLARVIESRLYHVSPWDPFAAGGAVGLVLLVALAAARPAVRRATRVDPAEVLRTS